MLLCESVGGQTSSLSVSLKETVCWSPGQPEEHVALYSCSSFLEVKRKVRAPLGWVVS